MQHRSFAAHIGTPNLAERHQLLKAVYIYVDDDAPLVRSFSLLQSP